VEEVLKITDNGVAVEKIYLYLAIDLLVVNQCTNASFLVENALLSLFLTFNSFSETSLAISNEALIKSGAKLCLPILYNNPPVWDFFF